MVPNTQWQPVESPKGRYRSSSFLIDILICIKGPYGLNNFKPICDGICKGYATFVHFSFVHLIRSYAEHVPIQWPYHYL